MKYNTKDLFVAEIEEVTTNTRYFRQYKSFKKAIIKLIDGHDKLFYDVINGYDYWQKNMALEIMGDHVVGKKTVLSDYLKALAIEVKDIDFLSNRINNIISTSLISKYDIRLIVKYLNNKESFNKKRIHFDFIGKIPEKLSLKKNYNNPILTSKKHNYNKSLGIEDEIEKLMMILAGDKCNPILVGPNGTGKSTIVSELSRRISKNEAPKFLKKKKIINMTGFITIDKKNEELKNEFIILMEECLKNKHIVFIDDIDKIFTKDNEITNLVKFYIKEKQLKVIGTITSTEKYKFYIDEGELYRNFTCILINEPTDEKLYEIIIQIFNNYSKQNNIRLYENMDFIIKELIELTKKENRIINDNLYKSEKEEIYNPDLVARIIDNIFAHAKVNNNKELDSKDIIFGIDMCKYINEVIKNKIINDININYITKEQKIIKK